MLTREHRLTHSRGFATAIRRGKRAGSRMLVVHLHTPPAGELGGSRRAHAATGPAAPPGARPLGAPRVGFVVSRAVGPAVTRNLVKRRLRSLVRTRVGSLPGGSTLVVRALPPAAGAGFSELEQALDRCLRRVRPRVCPEASNPGATGTTLA